MELILLVGAGLVIAAMLVAWRRQSQRFRTEQTRREAVIADLLERYHRLIESVPDGFFAHDLEGRFSEVNQFACDSTGYTREELLRMGVADLEQDFDLASAQRLWRGLRPGEARTLTSCLRRKDGRTVPVEVRISLARVYGEQTILALARDVSERRASEQALRASEFRYRELVENMSDGVAVYDAIDGGRDFRFRELNCAGERIGQVSREEVIGRCVTEVFPGVVELGLFEVLVNVWRDGVPRQHPINFYRDGRLALWVENYVFRLPGGEVVAVYDDVTERRRIEKALRESEADLRRAQTVGAIGSWRLDFTSGDAAWSEQTYRIFGVTPGTPISYPLILSTMVHPEDRVLVDNAWQAALRSSDAIYEIEHRIITAGSVRWVRERAELERDPDGAVTSAFGTAQDITDRKHAQEALLQKSEELQRINSELEEFAYIASHDLKAPLRAVANLALVVDEDAGECLDPENRRRLTLLRERVVGMHTLIDALLNYARSGRNSRQPVPVDVAALVERLAASLPAPSGFNIAWDTPSLPTLFADPTEVQEILQNLITNAMEHHDRPEVGHVWVRGCGAHCLEVADDGPGIPAHRREQVFRMFVSDGGPGHSGVGLAVVRKLILAAGGHIEVTGNTPRGSIFRLHWKRQIGEPG